MHEALAAAIVEQCRKRYAEGDCPVTERPGQEQTEFALIDVANERDKLKAEVDRLRLVVVHEGDCTQAADDEAMRRGHVIEELRADNDRLRDLLNKASIPANG